MTDTVNGSPPAAAQDAPAEAGGKSERVLGAFGLLFAAAVAFIAIDMLSGGRLTALLGRPESGDGG